MAYRPILFSGAMVRALLDGRKTQTRRVVSRQNMEVLGYRWGAKSPWEGLRFSEGEVRAGRPSDLYVPFCHPDDEPTSSVECGIYRLGPVIQVGDRLWVRESIHRDPDLWKYVADGTEVGWPARQSLATKRLDYAPSIHMPKVASRITLTDTEVRVQRLQEISDDDAVAEGVDLERYVAVSDSAGMHSCGEAEPTDPVEEYRNLWDSLSAARGYGWETNPWIVALTFTVERRNIDEVA